MLVKYLVKSLALRYKILAQNTLFHANYKHFECYEINHEKTEINTSMKNLFFSNPSAVE